MIPKKYQNRNNNWWLGQRVITTEAVSNFYGTISAGTVCTVTHKYGGLTIASPRCPKCAVSLRISRVAYGRLIYLDDVLEIEREKAIERAERESADIDMAVVAWNNGYLVIPHGIAIVSPYETLFACGLLDLDAR